MTYPKTLYIVIGVGHLGPMLSALIRGHPASDMALLIATDASGKTATGIGNGSEPHASGTLDEAMLAATELEVSQMKEIALEFSACALAPVSAADIFLEESGIDRPTRKRPTTKKPPFIEERGRHPTGFT